MAEVQDILVLFQTTPGLDAQVVAWSRYEASKGPGITDLVEEAEPPYRNAMAAMRDGWQVIQMSEMKHRPPGDAAYEDGPLPYQTVLSRFNPMVPDEETAQ
ncbi:MAG: hypothetical protein O2782_04260 [bacterium]|nr:hypothetical protein [bacterium]